MNHPKQILLFPAEASPAGGALEVRRVAFTGHRNAQTTEKALDKIRETFPGAVWVHGGAVGFDSQVAEYATRHGLAQEVIRPDYEAHGKPAPLIRNREIVARSQVLFACYDGRKVGGTDYTIRHAMNKGKQVHFLTCILANGEMIGGTW